MLKLVPYTRGLPISVRFERYVSPEPNSGCWLWLGAYISKGYGMLYHGGKIRLATHISLELAGHERPGPEYGALHKCDVPACVNPDHLYWGTVRQNFDDMIARGRGNLATKRKEFCVRGHRMADFQYISKTGYRQCGECCRVRSRARRAFKAGASQCCA